MKSLRLQQYRLDVASSINRRLIASLIDGVILMVLLLVTLILTNSFVAQTPSYKEKEAIINQERIAVYQLEEQARIYQFINNDNQQYLTPRPLEEMFKEYALRQVLLSYQVDPAPFDNYQIVIENEQGYEPASYTHDHLAYFYVTFVPLNNEFEGHQNDIVNYGVDTPEIYFYRMLKNASNDLSFWVLDETNYEYPYLNSSFAADLYRYLFIDDDYRAGLTNYNKLGLTYQSMWQTAVDQLVASQRFQRHYLVYLNYYGQASAMIATSSFLVYVFVFSLAYLLPQIIFKNMQTIGKKLLNIKIIDVHRYSANIWQHITRGVASFILFFGTMLIPVILAGGLQSGLMFPLFQVFGFGISFFHLTVASLIVSVITVLPGFFSREGRWLHDYIAQTLVIDYRYHDVMAKKNEEETITNIN